MVQIPSYVGEALLPRPSACYNKILPGLSDETAVNF